MVQWHYDPAAWQIGEPAIAARLLVQPDDPVAVAEQRHQRVAGWDRRGHRRHVPRARPFEGDVARRPHEQRAGRAVHHLGSGPDCPFLQSNEGFRRGQRIDAAHPFAAVVVAGAEEILHHHGANARPGGARGQDHRHRQDGGEDQRGLHHPAPFGAAAAKHLADRRDRHQEDAAGDQREAVEDDLAGDVDVDRPAPVAHDRQGDQRRRQDGGRGASFSSANDRWRNSAASAYSARSYRKTPPARRIAG